jgi:hypothetical protein
VKLGITGRKVCQSRFEGILHPLGVGCRQFVLFSQAPVRPHYRIVTGAKIIEFGDQTMSGGWSTGFSEAGRAHAPASK